MEPTEHEPEAQEAPAQEAQEAQEAHAVPEPKRRGRPPRSKNKPKQDVPTEPAAPKRKPKPPPLETPEAPAPVEAPAEAPAEAPPVEAPQLTREQQRALRMLERQSAYDRLTTGEPADGGRAPPGTPAALRAGRAPGRGTGGGRSCATVNEDTPGARLQPAPALRAGGGLP